MEAGVQRTARTSFDIDGVFPGGNGQDGNGERGSARVQCVVSNLARSDRQFSFAKDATWTTATGGFESPPPQTTLARRRGGISQRARHVLEIIPASFADQRERIMTGNRTFRFVDFRMLSPGFSVQGISGSPAAGQNRAPPALHISHHWCRHPDRVGNS